MYVDECKNIFFFFLIVSYGCVDEGVRISLIVNMFGLTYHNMWNIDIFVARKWLWNESFNQSKLSIIRKKTKLNGNRKSIYGFWHIRTISYMVNKWYSLLHLHSVCACVFVFVFNSLISKLSSGIFLIFVLNNYENQYKWFCLNRPQAHPIIII